MTSRPYPSDPHASDPQAFDPHESDQSIADFLRDHLLGSNPVGTEAEEEQRLRVARLRGVATDQLPLEAALRLLRGPGMDDDPAVRRAVLMRGDLPTEELIAALADPDPRTRAFAVGSRHMPVDRIISTADDVDWQVRFEVAQHPACPVEVLSGLATDPSPMVRRQALRHARTPVEVLLRVLLEGTSALDARIAAARSALDIEPHAPALLFANDFGALGLLDREDIPASLVDQYVHDERPATVRAKAAAHPACPAPAVERAARDTDARVRAAAASQPVCPASALIDAASDDDRHVRLACAGNPSAPASAVRALLRDPDERVRALAAAHAQAAPADLLEVVLHDTFAGPKLAALRNPNCDPAALELACGDPDLVLIAARNRSCSPEALVTALATMSVEDGPARRRARLPGAEDHRRPDVLRVARDVRKRLARRSWAWLAERDLTALHPADLVVLIGSRWAEAALDPRERIRAMVALMPETTADVLMMLARDPSEQVRQIVTQRILEAAGGDRTGS